jgi:hypothetical protein
VSQPDENVVPLAVPQKPVVGEELGVSMNMPFGIGWDGDELRNAEGKVQIEKLQEMRRKDGQVRALMRVLTLPIRAAVKTADCIPGDGDKGEAEFAKHMLFDPPQAGGMTTNLSMVMRKILLALVDGFAAFEIVLQVPDTGFNAGKITVRKIAYRPPTTITFKVDDNGGFNGFRQRATFKGKTVDKTIDPEYAFYYAANEEENPFYGVSYFETAFYHWDKKVKLYYLAHIAAQQSAVAGRMVELPVNPDKNEKNQVMQAAAGMGFNTAMGVPDGYKVSPWKSDGTFDFVKLIDHHNSQMSKSVLAAFIDGLERQVLIDNADKAPDDLFMMAIDAIMDEIATTITDHLLARIISFNFQNPVYPEFKFGQLSDATKEAVAEIFKSLSVATTTNVTPEFLHEMEKQMAERLNLDIDYTAIDKRVEEEQALKQEQAKTMAEAAIDAVKNPPADPAANPAAPAAAKGQPSVKGQAPVAPKGAKPVADKPIAATAGMVIDLEEVARLLQMDLARTDLEDPDDPDLI